MTRRDYVLVGGIIKTLPLDPTQKGKVREAFVKEFTKDKPTFNAAAFRKAS